MPTTYRTADRQVPQKANKQIVQTYHFAYDHHDKQTDKQEYRLTKEQTKPTQIVIISLHHKAMDMHQRLQHRELGAHLHPSRTFKMPTELHLEELVMIIVQF